MPVPLELRMHDLRHTCAAFLSEAGRHMDEVKEHLGHSSIRVTSDHYGHLFPKARLAIAGSLDEAYLEATTRRSADILRTRRSVAALGDQAESAESPGEEVISP